MTEGAETPRAPLLEVKDLYVQFAVRGERGASRDAVVRAVDGVSFSIGRGETLGLVGESGCGKSTLGRALLQLVRPRSGSVRLHVDGAAHELTGLRESALRPLRRHVQMIFQDPYASLNPRMTVGEIIAEPLRVFSRLDGAARRARVRELMDVCGLNPDFLSRYPHEFSGGQRQRIGIARALASSPSLIVCDEPISALDVSIQAQIMNLLRKLQGELGLSYLFIAHDLAAVRHVSHRIAVMYLGRIVEVAPAHGLYAAPQHPYTRALISAVPVPDPGRERTRERIVLRGDLPSPRNPPPGCTFHTRCPWAEEACRHTAPSLQTHGEHQVSCLRVGALDAPEGLEEEVVP
jgi:oligopeptide transport system ATP-binding protein